MSDLYGAVEYCLECNVFVSDDWRFHGKHLRTVADIATVRINKLTHRFEWKGLPQMSTPQPHVTIEAHPSRWQSILASVLQAITVVGPFVVQLVETDQGTAQVTVHQSQPAASNETGIKANS